MTLAPGVLEVLTPGASLPIGTGPVEVEADGPVSVELDPIPASTPGSEPVPVWPLLAGTAASP